MSQFFVTVPLPGKTRDQAQESLDNMTEESLRSLVFSQSVEQRKPVYQYEIPWQAMAILCGDPYATENELQDLFGNGRTSWAIPATKTPDGEKHIVGLRIAKECYPIKCYVVLDWLS